MFLLASNAQQAGGVLPDWLREFLPILILLVVVAVVISRLPKIELGHSNAFRRRRVLNWLPLGLTYAFLYMGRYNLTVAKNALGDLMTKEQFGTIFAVGTFVYGCAFVINGPLTDRFGGRKAILAASFGSAVMNVFMGVATYLLLHDAQWAARFGDHTTLIFSLLYACNMYFQSFGAVAIVKVNAAWFHVRERGVFGGIFGILISLGIYFAFDWGKLIVNYVSGITKTAIEAVGTVDATGALAQVEAETQSLVQAARTVGVAEPSYYFVFFVPAALLLIFFVIDLFVVRDTPGHTGHRDFDTADASSGDEGPQLGVIAVAKMMLSNPVIVTIALIEFCSGFLRNAIMHWYIIFAKQTGIMATFVPDNWGMLLCCAGIMGGVFAGTISDRVFQSRRGPVAAVLYGGMVLGAIGLTFILATPAVGWLVVFMSLCIIGVHGMLSGTASMDFGGKKNVGVAVGLIDGLVYLGTGCQAILYGKLLPHGKEASADPANWYLWPIIMIPMAVVGLVLALRVWNAKPKPRAQPAPAPAESEAEA